MNERGFREFVDGLRSSILADLVQKATPLSPIVGHRHTANRWRRFDEMSDWPDGLIAAGDSVCCFDPVHAQGMTTGILGALAIGDGLPAEWNGIAGGPAGFARRVQQQIVDVVRPAWDLATGQDLRLVSPTGRPQRTRDRLWLGYFDRLVAASTADATVRARLLAVMNMVDGPDTLFRPEVIARLAWHACGLNGTREPLWTERPAKQGNAAHAAERRTIDTSAA
jgi:2-polyprenyl-6-methoxyphenol hydroxylase-like FAD-dependent oxidoreductase